MTKINNQLIAAAQNGQYQELIIAIEVGASLSFHDIHGSTALHYAVQEHHEEIVNKLLAEGASINQANIRGQTPLHLAVLAGNMSLLQKLLARKAPLNTADASGWTVLHVAVAQGYRDMITELLRAGADLTIRDRNDQTPVELAKQRGQKDLADWLEQQARTTQQQVVNKTQQRELQFAQLEEAHADQQRTNVDLYKLLLITQRKNTELQTKLQKLLEVEQKYQEVMLRVQQMTTGITSKEQLLAQKDQYLREKDLLISQLQQRIEAQPRTEIALSPSLELTQKLNILEARITNLNQQLIERDQKLIQLQTEIENLKAEKAHLIMQKQVLTDDVKRLQEENSLLQQIIENISAMPSAPPSEDGSVHDEEMVLFETEPSGAVLDNASFEAQLHDIARQVIRGTIDGLKPEFGFTHLTGLQYGGKMHPGKETKLIKVLCNRIQANHVITEETLSSSNQQDVVKTLIYSLAQALQPLFTHMPKQRGMFARDIDHISFGVPEGKIQISKDLKTQIDQVLQPLVEQIKPIYPSI